MKTVEISYKDLTKGQLDMLKDLYIESRVNEMSEQELKKFVKEILDLQIKGTVGNEEEVEVWKEMDEHFNENFERTIKEVLKVKKVEDVTIDQEQEDFKKRLELLEQRKEEESHKNEDMW